jgi:hypothetical protein
MSHLDQRGSHNVFTSTGLRLPRRELEIGAISVAQTLSPHKEAEVTCSGAQFKVALCSPLGTLVTAFTHKSEPFVVRFAEHGRELSVLPAHQEELGLKLSHRLFVSTVPSDLGHMLLTPFTGTGLPRILAGVAVEHALAATGQASASVRFAHIRDTLKQCGLVVTHEVPIPLSEKLEAQAHERERRAKGLQFDYEGAKVLDAKAVMKRTVSREDAAEMERCNLFSHVRVIDVLDGRFRERRFPRD